MVALMFRLATLCQPFLRRDTRKLIASMMFSTNSSSVIPTCPTVTPRSRGFWSRNLTIDAKSFALALISSSWEKAMGNLPAR